MHLAPDANAAVRAIARLRLDHDLNVLIKGGQQTHQALAGEVRKPSVEECRHFRLINAHERCRCNLGQTLALDHLPDVARKLRLAPERPAAGSRSRPKLQRRGRCRRLSTVPASHAPADTELILDRGDAGQLLLGLGQSHIGEYVAAARNY